MKAKPSIRFIIDNNNTKENSEESARKEKGSKRVWANVSNSSYAGDEERYKKKWELDCFDYIDRMQHARYGDRWTMKGMEIKDGDKFGFRVDFDKRICDILYNGKVVRDGFTEIPNEIIPVISDEGYGEMSVSIEFLYGIARV